MIEGFYRRLMEFTGDGMYRYTFEDGRILMANRAFVQILGLKCAPEDLVGKKLRDLLIYTEKEGSVRHHLEEHGEIRGYEYHFKTLSGEDRWVIHDSQLVTDPATGMRVVEAIVKDVTERKIAEEQLQQYRLHLEELVEQRTAELKRAADELQRSNEDLEQFAYAASHDLQEPLRKVASFTQLLAERYGDKLDADGLQLIGYAVDGARRMQGLINDLLAYARVGTRGRPFAPVNCETALEYAISNLSIAIREGQAVITHDPLPTVMGDEVQLAQVFQNLVGNAVKFRRSDAPRVHVAAQHRDREWVFSVRDNGIGIEPQHFTRIFAVFQRLHSRSQYPGTGIGLSISKKVVERHGGRIWVESEPGKGSTFFFSIPDRPTDKPATGSAP